LNKFRLNIKFIVFTLFLASGALTGTVLSSQEIQSSQDCSFCDGSGCKPSKLTNKCVIHDSGSCSNEFGTCGPVPGIGEA